MLLSKANKGKRKEWRCRMRATGVATRSGPRGAGAGTGIRIRPVPPCDPPFDDELSPEIWAPAQQLALDLSAGIRVLEPAPEPRGAAETFAGPPSRQTAGAGSAQPGLRPPVVAGVSGEARMAVRRFVQMCVEVLNGYRPAAHLRRLSLPIEAGGVVAQGMCGARRVAEVRRGRPGDRRGRRPGPVAVLGLKLCQPRPGAVEATVVLVTGERTWAMALRLELHQDNWAATVLRLI